MAEFPQFIIILIYTLIVLPLGIDHFLFDPVLSQIMISAVDAGCQPEESGKSSPQQYDEQDQYHRSDLTAIADIL